jgi:hypothetical protein
MAQRSLDLLAAMYAIAEAVQPITGRGVGYKLLSQRLTASMAKKEMARVYRLLKEARERGINMGMDRRCDPRHRGAASANAPTRTRPALELPIFYTRLRHASCVDDTSEGPSSRRSRERSL